MKDLKAVLSASVGHNGASFIRSIMKIQKLLEKKQHVLQGLLGGVSPRM